MFVGGPQFLEKRYDWFRDAVDLPPDPVAVSQHYNSLALIAAQSDCIALIPRHLARLACEIMALRVLEPDFSKFRINVCLAWDQRHQFDQGHRWLRGKIKDAARAL